MRYFLAAAILVAFLGLVGLIGVAVYAFILWRFSRNNWF